VYITLIYIVWSDVTESIAILWALHDMMHCCSDKNESVSLRKCPRDRWLTNRAYLSAIPATNISQSFYLQDGGKDQLAQYSTKLRHCNPMYCPECEWHATYVNCSKLRTLHALIVKLSLYSTFYSNVYPTDSTVMLLLLGWRWCRCQAGLIIITSTSRWMKRPPRRRRWPPWKTKTPTSRRDAQGTICFLSPWSYIVSHEPFPDRSRPMSC